MNLVKTLCSLLLLPLILILLSGCITTNPQGIFGNVKKVEQPSIKSEKKSIEEESKQENGSKTVRVNEEINEQPDLDSKAIVYPNGTNAPTAQELLDSALDYCQTSNDFWEQGDLDNAIDALDIAYSITLKVNEENNPEILQQKEDLRFTISKRIIEVYSSRFTVANGSYKAIPLEMNKHVEKALKLFKGRERKWFLQAYKRSGQYRPAIVKALKEAGLPEELSWLPFIESGFKVRAFSRARALGMWQFIASTGYKFGLKRDRWIDERMDPQKSTVAAIAYLTELHKIFGDWTTALAAYNCGEGAVLRRIKTQKVNYLDNFWDLYRKLPRETAFYVPKFMAVLHIINDPAAHGFTLPPVDKEIPFEKATISKQVHLKNIAKKLGISYDSIRHLNPELRQNLTPKSQYTLNVPPDKTEIFLAKIKDIPVYRPPVPAYIVHRVRSGETLSVIAYKYKTSIRAIMNMNRLRSRNYLKVGWKLKIPTKRGATYTSKSKGKFVKYVVRKGDSMWKIANRYNTTVKAIKSINRLKSTRLQIGQVLTISKGTTRYGPALTKKYRVKRGDSPYLIAKRFNMNLYKFLKLNKLTPRSTIFPGQVVKISAE